MKHYFGSDAKGLSGTTPFEVLHQLLLGIMKYFQSISMNPKVLDLLYNYMNASLAIISS